MAKSSVPRHSKAARKPVTIDLEPSAISKPETKSKPVPPAEPVGFDPAANARQSAPAQGAQPAATSKEQEKPSMTASAASGEQSFGRTSPRPNQATAATPVPKPDRLGRIGAGVIGGLVALVGVAALQWAGLLPSAKPDLSGIEQQIAALQRSAQTPMQDLGEGAELALNGAVENSKKAVEQVSALSHEMSLIKQSLDEVKKSAGAGGSADTSALDARIAELETKLSANEQQTAQVAGATDRLAALEAKVNDTSGQANMALAMAATGLKSALDRGGPFTTELDTYTAVAPAPETAESLRAFAAKGVPTVTTLAGQFGDVAAKIVATTRAVDPNATILDRLWASAEGLVEARPVGMVEGESVDAITARIEASLNTGNLEAAIAEWEKLPENAKAVSNDFADAMKTRQQADAIVAKALSDALKGAKASPAGANQE